MSRLASIAHYATHERSQHPELWRDCVAAWMPGLGPTGLKLRDYSGRSGWGLLENMTLSTNWTISEGRPALDFGGGATSDRVLLYADVFWLGRVSQCTVTAWINSDTFATMAGVYARQGATSPYEGLSLTVENGYPAFRFNTNGTEVVATHTTITTAGKWHHIAGRRIGNTISVWLDGVEIVAATQGNWTIDTGNPASYIGNYVTRGNYFDGKLDDIRLYTRALSEAEIRLLGTRRCIAAEPRYTAVAVPVVTGVTTSGSVAATLASDAASASGKVIFAASAAVTLNDATGTAFSQVASVASVLVTTENATSAAAGTTAHVAAAFAALASDASAATGSTTTPGAVAATLGDDTPLAFGITTLTGSATATTGSDTSAAAGISGGSGGAIVSSLAGDTSVSSGLQTFSATASTQTGGDTSAAISIPFQSPIEILWEDQPTILWETGDVVEWDLLWVIYATVAGVAGPVTAAATGTHTPPPSAGGVIAATLGPAVAGPTSAGKLIFRGSAAVSSGIGAAGQATGSWSGADFAGSLHATLGNDVSALAGLLKFVGAITGAGSATGQILGPLIPIGGEGSTITDGGQVFVDIEACTFVGDASPFEFVGRSPDYRFRGQACGSCA